MKTNITYQTGLMIALASLCLTIFATNMAVASPNPHVVSCGEFLDNTKRQFLFEIPVGENGQVHEFYFSVGWINNFQHYTLKAKQIKERTGMTTHKIIFTTQDGRFRLEKNKGLMKSDDYWTLNMNMPEANVSLKDFQTSCTGYY